MSRLLGLVLFMADQTFVRIQFHAGKGNRLKLQFKHKDLRDAVNQSKKSIHDLFTDSFGGWPYLLWAGLRHMDPRMSIDKASEYIDAWCNTPDPALPLDHPDAMKPRTMDALGFLLLDALNASGFVRIDPVEEGKDEDEEDAEKNAMPEAV
jgi:hypothetical protein